MAKNRVSLAVGIGMLILSILACTDPNGVVREINKPLVPPAEVPAEITVDGVVHSLVALVSADARDEYVRVAEEAGILYVKGDAVDQRFPFYVEQARYVEFSELVSSAK